MKEVYKNIVVSTLPNLTYISYLLTRVRAMHWKTNPTNNSIRSRKALREYKKAMEVALNILYQPNIPLVVRQVSKENADGSNSVKNLATY